MCETFRGKPDDRCLLFENRSVQRYIVFIASQQQKIDIRNRVMELNELLEDIPVRIIGVCESGKFNWFKEMRKYREGIGQHCKAI